MTAKLEYLSKFILKFQMIFIYVLVMVIFRRALTNYFFMDDFEIFKLSWIKTVSDLPKLFHVIAFYPYRPFAQRIPTALFFSFFGLNSFAAHAVLFLLHGINIYLFWKL